MGNFKEKKPKSKRQKKLQGTKGLTLRQRIMDREEQLKGGPPNCVVCLIGINEQSSESNSEPGPKLPFIARTTLNPIQALHLCELLNLPLSFRQEFQEYSFCSSCYHRVGMAHTLLTLDSSDSCGASSACTRPKMEEDELELLLSQLKESLRRFQVSSKESQRVKSGSVSMDVLAFRGKVYKELQAVERRNRMTSQRTLDPPRKVNSFSHKPQCFQSTPSDPLDTSGPPNCLICMRGPSETADLEPLLLGECLNLIKLLNLPENLKQDVTSTKTYSCFECLVRVKNVTEAYKKLEEAKEYFEQGLLQLRTPNAKSASQINPDLVEFVILRRRVAKELQSSKFVFVSLTEPRRPSGFYAIESEEEEPDPPKSATASGGVSDTLQNLCEVVLNEDDESDPEGPTRHSPSEPTAEGSSDKAGKKFKQDVNKCPFCDKVYKRYKPLHIHLNRHHTDTIPFKCKLCDEGFLTPRKLERHANKHLGFKNNECRICHKMFATRASRIVHETKHSGVRSFGCDQCEKSYFAQTALYKHKIAIHGNEKYICDLCGKEQPSKHYLSAHLRRHEEVANGTVKPRRSYPVGRGNIPVVEDLQMLNPLSLVLKTS